MDSTTSKDHSSNGSQQQGDLANILQSLKDLEIAKCQLQTEFKDLLEERQTAEGKMAELKDRLAQTTDQFSKRQESLQINKLRASSVTTRAQTLEEHCHGLREKIAALHQELQKEKQKQIDDLNNFDAQMKDLKELFVQAVKFYSDENLSQEIESTKNQVQAYQEKMLAVESKVLEAQKELDALSQVPTVSDPWEQKLPIEQRSMVLDLLSKEQEELQKEVENLRDQKSTLLTQLSKQQ